MRFTLEAPRALAKFIAPKGSVALDGTSLTVNKVEGTRFDVLLIPYTRSSVHHAGERQAGDHVESRSRHRWRATPRGWLGGGWVAQQKRRWRRGPSSRQTCYRVSHSTYGLRCPPLRPKTPPTWRPKWLTLQTTEKPSACPRARRSHSSIVEARFYDDLADALLDGAKAALDEAGRDLRRRDRARRAGDPGRHLLRARRRRWRTAPTMTASSRSAPSSAARPIISTSSPTNRRARLMDLSVEESLAIGNGILTTENEEQAWTRAAQERGRQGRLRGARGRSP